MDRLLRAGNALLFVALAALVGWHAPDTIGDAPRARVTTTDLTLSRRIVPVDGFVDVVFPAPMVGRARVGDEAPPTLVVLEPAVDVVATWVAPTRLRLTPRRRFARARRYHVHLHANASDVAGAAVPHADLQFETPAPRVLRTLATDVRDGCARAVLVTFDMPIGARDLAAHLELLAVSADDAATDGAAIPFDLDPLDDADEHGFRLRMGDGPLPHGIRVRIADGLPALSGDVPLGETYVADVVLRTDLFVTGVEPRARSIVIEFSHEVPLPATGTIELDPPVAFQIVRRWDELRLQGAFTPGATYRVLLHAGFPGSGSVRLPEDVTRSVRLPDAHPALAFADRGVVLSSLARSELGVQTVNVQNVEVAARRVYPNNVVRLAQEGRAGDTICGPWRSRQIALDAPRNEESLTRVDLVGLLADAGVRGFHEIRIRDPDGGARTTRRLVQITDVAVTVRAAPGAVLVRTTSIASGRPLGDAAVTVLTPTNQVLARGSTGPDGVVTMPYADGMGADRRPFLVDVAHGDDRTFVDLDGYDVELADGAHAGRPYAGGTECWVAHDRGIVRPGGTLRSTVIARSGRGLSPVGVELELRWIAPGDRVHTTERRTVPDSGLLTAELSLASDAPSGTWRLDVVRTKADNDSVGGSTFLVESFVPDRLEAAVSVVDRPVLGGRARVVVQANWLEGGGAAHRPIRTVVRLDSLDSLPGDFSEYALGALREDEDRVPPGTLPVVRSVLDARGRCEVRVPLPDPDDVGAQAYTAHVEVEVTDPSGRPVRAGVSTVVTAPGPLLCARADGHDVSIALVDGPTGLLVPRPAHVTVSLERRRWHWTYARRSGGRFRWDTVVEAVTEHTLEADLTRGRVTLALPTADTSGASGGWIVAVVRGTVDGREVRVDAPLGARTQRPDRLRIAAEQSTYAAGDTARVRVAAPVAGELLVTVEGPGLHGHVTARVPRGVSTIDVPLPDYLDVPNVHLVATLVSGQAVAGAAPPFWLVGGTSVALVHPARRANVALDVAAEVLPESDVRVGIAAPGASQAVLALVDEGILRLTSFPDPDPLAYFLAPRRLDVLGADTGPRLFERPLFDPGALSGGDQSPVAALATRLTSATTAVVETVALWSGVVDLDADGNGVVTLPLPPYEGRLRAMVVACGPERIGAASSPVVVRAPLGLRIAAPRRLSPGDTSTATVTVRNSTGVAGEAIVQVAAEGMRVSDGGDARRIPLAPDEVFSFDVTLVATDSGDGRLLASARMETSALGTVQRERNATVRIRPLGVHESLRVGLLLTGTGTFEVPGEWAQDTAVGRLRVAPAPGAELLPALDALVDYPHGCAEQTTSRAFAVLAARALLVDLDPTLAGDAAEIIRGTVDRVRAFQTRDGGLALWIGGHASLDIASVCGLDFLLEAKDAGFQVHADSLRRLVRHVEKRLSRTTNTTFRCLAAEALSRAGVAVAPWLDSLADAPASPQERALLALGLTRSGQTDRARALLEATALGDPAQLDTGLGDPGTLLDSPVRTRALVLRALLAAAPTDPRIGVLVEDLRSRIARPATLTTNDAMHAVRALAAYHVARGSAAASATGTLRLGDVEYAAGALLDIAVAPGARVEYAIEGALPAFLEIDGVRLDQNTAATSQVANGLDVTRTIVDVETGREVTSIRRGGAYDVLLSVRAPARTRNLLVTDLLPGGLEARSIRRTSTTVDRKDEVTPDHVDVRDDRVFLHVDGPTNGRFVVRYRADGTFPGTYAAPPPVVEALYLPGSLRHAEVSGDGRLEVAR